MGAVIIFGVIVAVCCVLNWVTRGSVCWHKYEDKMYAVFLDGLLLDARVFSLTPSPMRWVSKQVCTRCGRVDGRTLESYERGGQVLVAEDEIQEYRDKWDPMLRQGFEAMNGDKIEDDLYDRARTGVTERIKNREGLISQEAVG